MAITALLPVVCFPLLGILSSNDVCATYMKVSSFVGCSNDESSYSHALCVQSYFPGCHFLNQVTYNVILETSSFHLFLEGRSYEVII